MTAVDDGCVTVAVPVRDEEGTIADALASLANQSIGPERIEVLVYDGRSTDRTREVAEDALAGHAWKHAEVLDNPEGTVPHALNAALARSTCTWFTRLDGRTAFGPTYLEACLAELAKRPDRTGIGGRFVAQASGAIPSSIAAAVTHRIGIGSGFRTATDTGTELSHHPFALWRTSDVRAFGGFDEELTRNQDDEFSMRARTQGARIYLTGDGEVTYRPRARFRGLASQYLQYGLWKSAVGRRRGLFPLRSLVPTSVVLATALAFLVSALATNPIPILALLVTYLVAGAVAAGRRRGARIVLTAFALYLVHMAYGTGILVGAVRPSLVTSKIAHGRVR